MPSFWAIIKALEICQSDHPDDIISLRSDSQAAVQAIDKEYTKNKEFQPLLEQIMQLSRQFPHFFIKWIPEKQNKAAVISLLGKRFARLNDIEAGTLSSRADLLLVFLYVSYLLLLNPAH